MPADVVIGGQWGDEGKGKIVDLMASDYNAVARFSGVTLTPVFIRLSISSIRTAGSTTQPLPITHLILLFKIPEGIR